MRNATINTASSAVAENSERRAGSHHRRRQETIAPTTTTTASAVSAHGTSANARHAGVTPNTKPVARSNIRTDRAMNPKAKTGQPSASR